MPEESYEYLFQITWPNIMWNKRRKETIKQRLFHRKARYCNITKKILLEYNFFCPFLFVMFWFFVVLLWFFVFLVILRVICTCFHSILQFAINVYWNINFLIFLIFLHKSFFVNIFCTLNRHGRGCVFCQVNNNRIEFFEPDTTCIRCILFIWDEMSFLWDFKLYFVLHLCILFNCCLRYSDYCVQINQLVLSWHIIS